MNIFKTVRTKMSKSEAEAGFSTLEIMIAFFVLTISITGVSSIAFGNQSISVDTERNNEALQVAQATLEGVRATARSSFDTVVSGPAAAPVGYTNTLTVQSLSQNAKQVTSTVTWNYDTRPQQVSLSSLVTNLTEEVATGGGGDGPPGGNPGNGNPPPGGGGPGGGGSPSNCPTVKSVTQLTTPLVNGSIATGLDVYGNYAYLAVQPNSPTGDDFVVVDISNSAAPQIVANLATGNGGLTAVDVASGGDGHMYAYAATKNSAAQLVIIDVTAPSAPFVVPGSAIKLSGNNSAGTSIFYRDHKVYIGTALNGGKELFVVDVTNPATPNPLAQYNVGATVNKIYVRDTTAYLAIADTTKQMITLNVSGVAVGNIVAFSSFTDPGSVGGQSLYYSDGKMYLGSMLGVPGLPVLPKIFALNSAPPHSVFGSKLMGIGALDMFALNNIVYLGTSNSSATFAMIDATNPANMQFCPDMKSLGAPASGVHYSNGLLYISVQSQTGLGIIKFN